MAVEVSVRTEVFLGSSGFGPFTVSFLMTIFLMVIGEVVEMYPLGAEICLSIHFSDSFDLKCENYSPPCPAPTLIERQGLTLISPLPCWPIEF